MALGGGTVSECRSNWYADSGVRQNHGDREVRCSLPEGHEGLHVELIDGQAANAWPPTWRLRRRSNEEQIGYLQDAVCRLISEREEQRQAGFDLAVAALRDDPAWRKWRRTLRQAAPDHYVPGALTEAERNGAADYLAAVRTEVLGGGT